MNLRIWMLAPALVLSLGLTLLAKPITPDLTKEGAGDVMEDPLPEGAVGRLGSLRLRHPSHMLAFSPDGRVLASAGSVTRLFDGRTGRLLRDVGQSSYVAFSPDNKLLFTSPYGFKPLVRTWDLDSGAERRQFTAAGGGNFFPTWSRDGKIMIASYFNGGAFAVTLWDMATGNVLRTFANPTNDHGGSQVSLTPDGKFFALHGNQNLYLFDAATGQEVRRFASPVGQFGRTLETATFAFSADGTKLACTDNGNVTVWNLAGQALQRLQVDTGKAVAVALSPEGQFLAAGTSNGHILIWDVHAGKLLHNLQDSHGSLPIYLLAFSPNGKTLASQQHIVTQVRLWDVRSGRDLAPLTGPTTPVDSVALSPDGSHMVATDRDGKIWHWTRKEASQLYRFTGVQPNFGASGNVSILADGKTALLNKGTIYLWDLSTARGPMSQPKIPTNLPTGRVFPELSPDQGKTILMSFPGAEKRRINPGNGPMANPVPPAPGGVGLPPGAPLPAPVAHPPQGPVRPGLPPRLPPPPPPPPPPRPIIIHWTMIGLWDVQAGKQVSSFKVEAENLAHLALDPAGKKVAGIGNALTANGPQVTIFLWDLATGKELSRVPLHITDGRQMAFSADGKTLITGPHYSHQTKKCTLYRWDLNKGNLESKLDCEVPFGNSPTMALAADRFAALNNGQVIHLIDVATGKELRRFEGHRSHVSSMSFSADARFLASGSNDTTALIWDLTKLAAAAR